MPTTAVNSAVCVLENPVRSYAWGSRTAIPDLLGVPPSGQPQAELWMGAHPAAPSMVVRGGRRRSLLARIEADPVGELGEDVAAEFGSRLPFLLKVIAADAPLSLQAHPDAAQALEGYIEENARGIPLDAPERNYRDTSHKPELLVALGPFDALCGFRSVPETVRLLASLVSCGSAAPARSLEAKAAAGLRPHLAALQARPDQDGLREVVTGLLTLPEGRRIGLVAAVAAACRLCVGQGAAPGAAQPAPEPGSGAESGSEPGAGSGPGPGAGSGLGPGAGSGLGPGAGSGPGPGAGSGVGPGATAVPFAAELRTAVALSDAYPGDVGAVIALLLNLVHMEAGEAIFLPAGNLHAYLRGVGVEIMANSDNVLRGGLTPKHVDVPELLRVLDVVAGPVAIPRLRPAEPGEEVYGVPVREFRLSRLRPAGPAGVGLSAGGPQILLVVDGEVTVAPADAAGQPVQLSRGASAWIPAGVAVTVTGEGTAFRATTNLR